MSIFSDLDLDIFSDLTLELAEQAKSCKSPRELREVLKGHTALTEEELTDISGGVNVGDPDMDEEEYRKRIEKEHWEKECRGTDLYGDSCKDVKAENVSRDFATGRITGADFFA